jgi:spore germination cell wall hydrolase CwlJ-like protein
MLNRHNVRRIFVLTILTSVFVTGISFLYQTQAQARQVQELESKRAMMLKEQKRIQEARLEREITCMARNIYFESASEPVRGKIAVAQVTLNRVHSGEFPSTVCAVVHQKTSYEGQTVCQFSWVCERNLKIRAPELYNESLRVARRVMLDGVRLPELRGAKYFHATYIHPGWNRRPKATIGNHIFY